MHWNIQQNSKRIAVVLLGLLAGCNEYINPWQDETVGPEMVTTASAEGARAHPSAEDLHSRGYAPTVVMPQDGTVTHFPLWWQDPLEDRGSDDGRFAWTWVDYFGMPYCLARFDLNTLAFPISVVLEPPVPLMESDGVTSTHTLGGDYDARWMPAGGTSTPPDILEIGTTPIESQDAGT
jgi:hypothetical protein